MHAGLGVLRWPPHAFWQATPRELAAALQLSGMDRPAMHAADLRTLIDRYPDDGG